MNVLAALLLCGVAAAQPAVDFIKVNCGGPELRDIGFLADEPYFYERSAGVAREYADPAAPVVPIPWGEVYRTQRYAEGGALTYRFPVPEGVYSVGLMFVEQYDFEGAPLKAARVMDLYINDVPLDAAIDVWSLAGEKLFEPYFLNKLDIPSVDGYITISLVPVVENPMLSGIVIQGPNAASILWKTVDGRTPTPDAPADPIIEPLLIEAPPAPAPTAAPTPARLEPAPTLVNSGSWANVEYTSGAPVPRHEACAVMADGLLYAIGGRGMKPISVYDPVERMWHERTGPPVEINHMQCVFFRNRIYIGDSWYGAFPVEREHTVMWAYDLATDTWLQLKGLPEGRRRGGGAFVEYDGKLYLSHGAIGGHGVHATTTGYLDVYDPDTNEWTALPDAPNPRDHTAGGVVNGKLCVAGGRNGGVADFWNDNIGPIDCYNFATNRWEQKASLPVPRGGAMVGATCQGLLMVAGGEGKTPENQVGQAFDRVDLFDEASNSFLEPTYMTSRRHGSGLGITSCSCGNIYVPSGSAGLGGGPEVSTTDVWSPDGASRTCI